MTLGQRLALTHPWWMWTHPPIVRAVARVHLQHWLPRYQAALEANKREGRMPSRREDLAGDLFLCRDKRNVERMEADCSQLTSQLLLGLSYTFSIPVDSFFPPWVDWIAKAALLLCRGSDSCREEVSAQEARAYALYRQRRAALYDEPGGPQLDAHAVDAVREALEPALTARVVEGMVLKVATVLGRVLEGLAAP